MKQKIIFFGAGPYVGPILEILNRNFDLELVITTETNRNSAVLSFCSKNSIEVENIADFNSHIIHQIRKLNVQAAVLASFGLFIPDEVLNLFEMGIINIHPSLLPKYRGATPGQAAIINGDKTTGVSIIKLDSELDHGPLLAQIEADIEPNDTGDSLYKKLFQKGADMLTEFLPKYLNGEIKLKEQDHSEATLTDRLTRSVGHVDISDKIDSVLLERMIRAYYPWPGVWFKAKLNGKEKVIKLLPEQKLQVEGKRIMQLADFRNGYPEAPQILKKLALPFYSKV